MNDLINKVVAAALVADRIGCDRDAAWAWLSEREKDGTVPQWVVDNRGDKRRATSTDWAVKLACELAEFRVSRADVDAALDARRVPAQRRELPRGVPAIAILRAALRQCDVSRTNTELANDLAQLFPDRCKVDDDGRLDLDGEDRHSQLVKALTEARRG